MKKLLTGVIIFLILTCSCYHKKTARDVYRYYWGIKDGYKVWIIDGNRVREDIYNSFLYGGNEQRYPFTPKGEIWIDNAISSEEFDLTLAHELNERHLMAKYGWSYYRAHDSSLALEVRIRKSNAGICRLHEASLGKVVPRDRDNTKEIRGIPDSIALRDIYRVPLGTRNGISIWVVDGYRVRATIFPDFGFSGNDLEYRFIPSREIWIDGQVSCEETEYSIATEMFERSLMAKGFSYSIAYDSAIDVNTLSRGVMHDLVKKHPSVSIPDSIAKDIGTIDPGEK